MKNLFLYSETLKFCCTLKKKKRTITLIFETIDKIEDDEHVPRRLNEAFFQKLQEFGGERGKEKSNESQPAAPDPLSRSKSVKGRRRSSEVDSDDVRRITNPKRRNSSIQDERSIHDAYHAILNEYNRVGVYSAGSHNICHLKISS